MTGSGRHDATRFDARDLDRATVHVTPDERGAGVAGSCRAAAFSRRGVRFERDVKLQRDGQLTEADTAVAHLTPDEKRSADGAAWADRDHDEQTIGRRSAGAGQDMDLKYAADGQIRSAVLTGTEPSFLQACRRLAARSSGHHRYSLALTAPHPSR